LLSVPYSFLELRLQVVVVGLPLLTVNKVAGADLGSILSPVSARIRKYNESGFDVVYLYCLVAENQPRIKENSNPY
jgi:hypothetical protein